MSSFRRMMEQRQSLRRLVEAGAMPRENADKVMEATRESSARFQATEDGEVYLYDFVDSWGGFWGVSAAEVREAISGFGEGDTITMRLNSPGGEAHEGRAIYNLLRQHPAQVHVVVDGMAASAASVVAMAGDRITMNAGAEMMIHNAWTGMVGDHHDLAREADNLRRISEVSADIYAARSGVGDRDHWMDLMSAETWWFHDGAVEAGLADDAEQYKTKDAVNQSADKPALWDRSMFTKIEAVQAVEIPPNDAPEDEETVTAATAADPELLASQRAQRAASKRTLAALRASH